MISRREWVRVALGTGAAAGITPRLLRALEWLPQGRLIERAIPTTGERLPVIGLGSSATFAQVARSEEVTALGEVLKTLVEQGGRVFDTAPGYGSSEEVAARLANELGIAGRIFWATKVNVARGGGQADPAEARAQIDRSFARIKQPKVDLIQVHNMGDPATQLPILREYKRQGKIRYLGITTTFEQQYQQLIDVMRNEPLDFIGTDYAADNRGVVEDTILPLAMERKIAVLAYAPFGRTSLFRRVGDRPLPEWAAEFDAKSWPQLFLKWVVGHPAVTCVTPATSRAEHMVDNLGGGIGRLPDAAMRKRIADYVDALPAPPPRGRPG
jgi:aryl-alcohol dehydrogenase-like predicted oxidoreductase